MRAWPLLCMLSLVPLAGCSRSSVPVEHTSLAIDAGPDPGKPPRRLSMVWHHHSTGDDLLEGGLREALERNGIDFFDINYKEAIVDGYVIGDHTDPQDFPKNFNTPKYFEVIKGWELGGRGETGKAATSQARKQHDIVMFKSCFPASDIKDEAQLESYKKWYLSLLPTFKAHPRILFIAMSTPPLVKAETTPENAARARRWARWVSTEYPRQAPNVKVFDLFNALAIAEGKPDQNTLAPQFATARDDSHPSREGARAMTRLFIPWLNRALREAGVGGSASGSQSERSQAGEGEPGATGGRVK